MKIVAIKLKGEALDEFGCQKYIWATKEQAKKIMDSQYTDDHGFMFQIGDVFIRANDIAMMKIMDLESAKSLPSFKPYILEAIEREKREEQARLNQMTDRQRLMTGKINNKIKMFVESHKIE